MACHGDVVSLKDTIGRLVQSPKLNSESRGIIEFLASGMVKSVLRLLLHLDVSCGLIESLSDDGWVNSISDVLNRGRSGRSSSSRNIRPIGQRMNGLDAKMREAARELEDALETHLLSNAAHQQQEKLKQDIESFCRKVIELKEEYAKAEKEEAEEEINSRIDDDNLAAKMVGYSDVLAKMKDDLLPPKSIRVLVGMAGIGKTTLARAFFEDQTVIDFYDYRVWVNVGAKYQLTDILESIVNQVNPNTTTGDILTEGYELISQFKAIIEGRRCLVVLDDVWNKEVFGPVRELLGEDQDDSQSYMLLVTSRQEKMGDEGSLYSWDIEKFKLRFMNKEESWDLLREKVFGANLATCTPQLVKAGKKIADNCEGLPLTIVTVADILSKADDTMMTPEYWNQVAEGQNSVFVDAYERISKVLLRSYEFLPRYLKEYFLYTGIFPQKYDIPHSKLALLWGVERCFVSTSLNHPWGDLRPYVSDPMKELVGKSLVLLRKTTFNDKPKTYSLHSALWHSCVGEAEKNKFFHVFNKYADILEAGRKRNQRRLCVHNNVLFAIKDVCNSMASISTTRSLLCTGQHHQYPVPVCFNNLSLLRIIDALTVRFYEFPTQVVELVLLRYLAITCDGKLPNCISKLSNLEILIVRRYMNIVKPHEKDESYLPMEIWDMKQLKHLQVVGEDLREPRAGVVLPNLVTLMDANARSCTKGVLEGLPNLKKLGIRIVLSADDADDAKPLSITSYHNKKNFLSLKCVVVNPVFRWSPVVSSLLFPTLLKKLSLNGLGCPWEDINEAVASLPKLEVLKLRCYAFRGAKWETPEYGFVPLQFLLIEDTDLVHWTLGNGSFERLQCLVLKECYKLQDIQPGFRKPLKRIEMVNCSPSAVACVKQMQTNGSALEVFVNSSWDDDGKKLKE